MPEISVIIPVYNRENYLRRCIDSVLRQTFRDLEIILVDDGSTDGSLELCRAYEKQDSRVKVIAKSNREGVSKARNKGMEAAAGEWIGFVDSDDWIEPDMYQILYDLAVRHNAQLAVCARYSHRKTGHVQVCCADRALVLLLAKMRVGMGCCNKLYKRQCFETVKFPAGIKIGEDAMVNVRILAESQGLAVFKNVNKYHVERADNNCAATCSVQDKLEVLRISKAFLCICEKKSAKVQKAAIDRYLINLIGRFLAVDLGNNQLALKELKGEARRYLKHFLMSVHPPARYKASAILIAVSPRLFNCLVNRLIRKKD